MAISSNSNHQSLHRRSKRQSATEVIRRHQDAYGSIDVAVILVLAVLWLVLPYDASIGIRIGGAAFMVSVAAATPTVRAKAKAPGRSWVFNAFRIGSALMLALALPIMWNASMMCVAVVLVGSIPVEPGRRILPFAAGSVVLASAVAIIGSVPLWYLTSAAALVSILACDIWFDRWFNGQAEINQAHNEMVDRARMFSWEVDKTTGEILGVGGNVEAVLGYSAEELLGRNVATFVDVEGQQRALAESPDDGEHAAAVVVHHRDGRLVHLREVQRRATANGTIRGVSIDMTELALATEALRHQAEHDALTGLANRSLVERRATDALGSNGGGEVALILADLDRFKEINDTLGHPTGDRVLCILASRFAEELGSAEVVARLGGDEFAVVVSGGLREAVDLANELHALAIAPMAVDGLQLAVACSVGVAIAPDHGSTFADLLKHADIATYQVKRAGGGVQVFESTPDAFSITRLQLISEVPDALNHNQFELHMQPQVDLRTGEIVAAEGLARWRHPGFGLLMPGSFLDAIEVASDYHRFTRELLRQAVELAAAAVALGRPIPVAVNLSSMSFIDKSLPGYVARLLADRGLPGSLLTLEVTESDLLDKDGADVPIFAALKLMGVRLSLDDFGTGHSSLTRLRTLDVDEVKVDRDFVAGLDRHSEDAIIVQTIVRLGQLLGHDAVAEGVETVSQLATLKVLGCTTAQGFLFAKPMPQREFLDLLASGASYQRSINPQPVR